MTLIKLGRLRAIYISRACAKAIYVTHKTQWREILRLRQHQRRKDARLFFFFFLKLHLYFSLATSGFARRCWIFCVSLSRFVIALGGWETLEFENRVFRLSGRCRWDFVNFARATYIIRRDDEDRR